VLIAVDCSKSMEDYIVSKTSKKVWTGKEEKPDSGRVSSYLKKYSKLILIHSDNDAVYLARQLLRDSRFADLSYKSLSEAASDWLQEHRKMEREVLLEEIRMDSSAVDETSIADQLPDGFLCPITHNVMSDPVTAIDGHSYEQSAIESWFQKNPTSIMSPCTGLPMESSFVVPNIALKKSIQDIQNRTDALGSLLRNRNRTSSQRFYIVSNGGIFDYNVMNASEAQEKFLNRRFPYSSQAMVSASGDASKGGISAITSGGCISTSTSTSNSTSTSSSTSNSNSAGGRLSSGKLNVRMTFDGAKEEMNKRRVEEQNTARSKWSFYPDPLDPTVFYASK